MIFKARNGGMAIAIRNHIVCVRLFAVTLALSVIPTIVLVAQKEPFFWVFLLLPAFFLILSFAVLLGIRYDERVFLTGAKKDHVFEIKDGAIYKDRKEIRLAHCIKVYRYKGFLYMETSHSMFIVRDTDYSVGSRAELISWAKNAGIKVLTGY